MNEKKITSKQFLVNMAIIYLVVTILFLSFDILIYETISNILYEEIDAELTTTAEQLYKSKNYGDINRKINPRLIYIIRNNNGQILNENSIGKFYDYLLDIKFSKEKINKIYALEINNSYNYRGITIELPGTESIYIQLLVNVDGEIQTLDNLMKMLFWGTGIIVIVSILASYILAKKTLNPVIYSLKKQTEFVQNASHELRTPLTIIQAKQELLLEEPNSKIIDKSEDINIILKETKRLTKLIHELMVLASADSERMELQREITNIDNLITEVTNPYVEFASFQGKKVNLDLKFSQNISIDKNKISQLLVIILDNSIKYTSENDYIEIKTYIKDNHCIIEIADTGIGISKEGMKHIFDRFYREDKARSRENGGNGLRFIYCIYNSKSARWHNKSYRKSAKGYKNYCKIIKTIELKNKKCYHLKMKKYKEDI